MSNIVSTDPIADMLTRIRNAINVRKSEVSMPHSKVQQARSPSLQRQQRNPCRQAWPRYRYRLNL